jgi:hypothetical protein
MTSTVSKARARRRPNRLQLTLVDVESLDAGKPRQSIKTFTIAGKPRRIRCDIFIAGGGMGGVAAAIAAVKAGAKVCLSEETSWLGGQMTAQGVSALDENYLVETSGATATYLALRKAIRSHYREIAAEKAAENDRLDPGNCWVSRLAFEPQVALAKLDELLAPATKKQQLRIFPRHKVVALRIERGKIKGALAVDLDTGNFIEFRPGICLDATELGDLLPLAAVPYNTGAESREQTGEPHAPTEANQENVQDFVYPFVVEFRQGERHVIDKPNHYDEFLAQGKFTFAGYKMFAETTFTDPSGSTAKRLPFWNYRRLIASENFPSSQYKHDIAMINWESNDLRGQNIVDQPAELVADRLTMAKDLSLGFLYWLQTEAPRDDGGKGYGELFLRTDILGSPDGLSKYPYIRESRRIKAVLTVIEQNIAAAFNETARAKTFADSVGIGLYPIDIHGAQDVAGAGQASRPFQIPLRAMVQKQIANLIPACKNIGTTHVTNGAYRLHPVEWAIGEAAGHLAAICLSKRTVPYRLSSNRLKLRQLQLSLLNAGAPVFWFDDVSPNQPEFAAIQFMAITGLMSGSDTDLRFRPSDPVTRADAKSVFEKLLSAVGVADTKIFVFHAEGGSSGKKAGSKDSSAATFDETLPLKADDLNLPSLCRAFGQTLTIPTPPFEHKLTRRQFAQAIFPLVASKKFLGKF